MFQFFSSVGSIFKTAVNYIVGLLELLINLVKLVFRAQTFLLGIVTSLPPFIVTFALIFISIAILFQILNKGS